MPTIAAAQPEDQPSDTFEAPNVKENQNGIRGVLLGPPGSGKGTQVCARVFNTRVLGIYESNPI